VEHRFLLKNGRMWFWKRSAHGAGVGAVVDLEGVGDAVFVEDVVEFAGVEGEIVPNCW